MLITGGSGFLSLECVRQALEAGHRVRTTVRAKAKEQIVLDGLAKASCDTSRLTFVHADLTKDDGWTEAARDTDIVLHVASPFPIVQPADENDLIRPAVEGTLRVLRAAAAAGTVKRVVVTSSVAAMAYGNPYEPGQVVTEKDWSNPNGATITSYAKSKTLAERAAWDYMAKPEASRLELATVNPVAIFGPALVLPNESSTCGIIKQMLEGAMPAVPNVRFGAVDVRDVAALHLLVAAAPEANGKRFIAVAGESVSLAQIGGILKQGLGAKASKAPTMTLPDFLVRALSLVMSQLKAVTPELGKSKEFSNELAKSIGWKPRSNEESIVSCGQAWIDAGALKV